MTYKAQKPAKIETQSAISEILYSE